MGGPSLCIAKIGERDMRGPVPPDPQLPRDFLRTVEPDAHGAIQRPHPLHQQTSAQFHDVRSRSVIPQDDPLHPIPNGLHDALVESGLGEPVRNQDQSG